MATQVTAVQCRTAHRHSSADCVGDGDGLRPLLPYLIVYSQVISSYSVALATME